MLMYANRRIDHFCRLWLALGVVALLLAGCGVGGGAGGGVELDGAKKIALENFPVGVGRGYPSAQLIAGQQGNPTLQPGSPAPNFALLLADGSHLSLSDLQGRPVVINFWATWCGPCRLEMPELMRAATADPDLVLLAINTKEELDTVQPFADDFTMTTPVVLDSKGDVNNLYAVRGLPTTYFIDASGAISAIHQGVLIPPTLKERLDALR